MSDTTFEYNEAKARQGIELIAHNADMLEQTASNLAKIAPYISQDKLMKSFGMEIRSRRERSGYELVQGNTVLDVRSRDQTTATDSSTLYAFAAQALQNTVEQTIDAMNHAGLLAHEVHLDRRGLDHDEVRVVAHLPKHLANAQKAMEAYVASAERTPANLENVTQAQRDADYTAQLAGEMGTLGRQVVEHNGKIVERLSKRRKVSEIAADKDKKFTDGMGMLIRSHDLAMDDNPAYAERVSKRKPLDAVILTPDEVREQRAKTSEPAR